MYSAVRHLLRAMDATGTDDPSRVMGRMRQLEVDDDLFRNGRVRADGQMVHDMYLVRGKRPNDVGGPADYLDVVETVPPEQAFQPLAESRCPMVIQARSGSGD